MKNTNQSLETRALTVADMARRLSVCPETIRRMCKRGELPHYRAGRLLRFEPNTLPTQRQTVRQNGQTRERLAA
jgi:excisionase family DNA binding protein